MLDINIFIASSFEMADWRNAIGHIIGMLSEEWEPRGYRIKMKCWEDYYPEFDGERKQDQYNRDLVLKSQIFVALFGEKCGDYTQEEIRLGKKHCKDDLYVLRKIGVPSSSVDQFLFIEGLHAEECGTETEVTEKVRVYIESYVSKHTTTGNTLQQDQKIVYCTIPDDCCEYRNLFGNMVRSLDDIMCENVNLRCRLRMDNPDQVCQSNYYVAILKNTLSNQNEKELVNAISHVGSTDFPDAVQLYADSNCKVIADSPALNALIQSKGLFLEAFQGNMFRIRYNLFRWLLKSQIINVNEQAGLGVRDGMLTFFNIPIISIDLLNIKANAKAAFVSQVIRQFGFTMLCDDVTASLPSEEAIDIAQLDNSIDANTQILGAATDIIENAIVKLDEKKQQIAARMAYLNQSEEIRSQHIEELSNLSIRLAKVQRQLLAFGHGDAYNLMRTLMFTVQMHDTYTLQFHSLGYDINAHYKEIADMADKYDINDPTVEMIRFNYANYLARTNRNQEALRIYEQVTSSLNKMDDSSKLIRAYVMHLSVTCINHFSGLALIEMAQANIALLESKIRHWNGYGRSKVDMLVDEVRLMACKLRVPNINDEDKFSLVQNALKLYEQLKKADMGEFPVGLWDEMYCDFPIVITSNLIDIAMQRKNLKYFEQGFVLQLRVIQTIEKNNILDEYLTLTYLGKAYHNIGFILHCSYCDIGKSYDYVSKALSCRRKAYDMTNLATDLQLVAETLLLMGALFADRQKYECEPFSDAAESEALKYADECLSIYKSLDTEHFLNQETDVYKAKLLRGSILVWSRFDKHLAEGIDLLQDCLQWNEKHPDNTYHQTIQDTAIPELKRLRVLI